MERHRVRFLVDNKQELPLLDVSPLDEMTLREEPAHPGTDGDVFERAGRPVWSDHDRDVHPARLDDADRRRGRLGVDRRFLAPGEGQRRERRTEAGNCKGCRADEFQAISSHEFELLGLE